MKPIYYIRTHAGQMKWEGEDLFATQSEYDYSTYNLYQNGVDFTSYFNINIDKRWYDWLKEQRAYMALY
ncbi:MAG: hypothetical protein IPO21_10280 [Bacteroidales bacterium]|nr:hypothetical protein [Bacteroidales bacterium]